MTDLISKCLVHISMAPAHVPGSIPKTPLDLQAPHLPAQVLQAFRFSSWSTPIGAGNSRSARLATPPRLYLMFDQPKRRDQGVVSWPPPKHMSKTDSVTSVASRMEPCYWRDDFLYHVLSSIAAVGLDIQSHHIRSLTASQNTIQHQFTDLQSTPLAFPPERRSYSVLGHGLSNLVC